MTDNTPITDNEDANAASTTPEGVDPEKLKNLLARVKALKEVPAGEAPAAAGEPEQAQGPITGRDVDWSEYDIPFAFRHLYPQAVLRDTQDGPKWVAVLPEFYSEELNIGGHGKKTKAGMLLNLGEFLTNKLMSPDGWRLSGIIPSGMGRVAVLLERQMPFVLPDPKPLEKETKVETPGDPELEKEEDAAETWAAGLTEGQDVGKVGLRPAAIAAADDVVALLEGRDPNPTTEGEPDAPSV